MLKHYKKTARLLSGAMLILAGSWVCHALAEFPAGSGFLDPADILPVDEAFVLTASETGGVVNLYWQIKPGYYLYRHRLKIAANTDIGSLELAPGIIKEDEYFGEVEVYFEEMDVRVPVGNTPGDGLQMTVQYQGCAEVGVCYPMQKKQLSPLKR